MTDQGRAVVRMDRNYFLSEIWSPGPGEHVTIVGPTGSGKTWLAYQLLGAVATPKNPAVVLVMKPRDSTVTRWSRQAGFRRVRSWPPPPTLWQPNRPPGWVVWPRHTFDPYKDDEHLYQQFRRTILDCYKRGNRIVFADEGYGLTNDLGLGRELVTVWTRGRSMGTALWCASQRPTHIPLHAYSQAEHLFLANDPDRRARDRYAEIGGVDPAMVRAETERLNPYEWLYVKRTGREVCVVQR